MSAEDWLIHGTALGALASYAASLVDILDGRSERARLLSTAGFTLFLLHVASAFHFEHDWSHELAYRATAERTAEVVGWHWGGGLYANYAFTLVWCVDLAWWWLARKQQERRPVAVTWAVHGFLLFMAFNATIVFGRWPACTLGLVACLWLIHACRKRLARRRSQ